MKNIEINGSASIDWIYPEIYGNEKAKDTITLALSHTRAAADIQIQYDSEKDGWEISRTLKNGQRRLLAFIPAWSEDASGLE